MFELNLNIERRDPFTMALRLVAAGQRLEPSERAILASRGWTKPTKRAALAELARMGRTRLS